MALLFQVGGIEHTNDWDIRISFTLRDGTVIGEQESDDDYRWSDSFSTPIEATEDLQVIDQDKILAIEEIEVEVWPSEGNEPDNIKLKIEDIVKFYIGD